MEAIVLASGSKGNATYLKKGDTALLIDAGISHKAFRERLALREISFEGLDGMLLTHAHSDHTRGLTSLLNKIPTTLFTTESTYAAVMNKLPKNTPHETIAPDQPFTIGAFTITPLLLSHDSKTTLGFVFECEGKRLVYITDTGFIPELDYPLIGNAEMYIFEANYDVAMLFRSERPHYLKQRIDSVKGHLSNADSAYYLTQLVGDKTKTLVLAHPSEECNTKEHTLETFSSVFESYELSLGDFDVAIAGQKRPTKVFKL